jgi:amino acid transporter
MAGLQRKLGPAEAMALSLALMAPTLSASLNGSGIAALAGQSVALVMVLTTVGVALVAFAFIKLTRAYNHAGSVYALTGATLGPRCGFFSGFALLGVYLAFSGSTLTGTNVFAQAFLSSLGADISGGALWLLISVAAAVLGFVLATADVRFIARALLAIEGVSVVLILVLSAVVLVKVAANGHTLGSATGGSISSSPFTSGTVGIGVLASASVLGFFSFAGFEASASLGEETARPRRYIPLALGVSVLFGGLLFVFAFYVQSIGFGTNAAGIKAYSTSSAPIGDLATFYVGKWMEVLLDLGALLSAFGALLGCVAAGGRLLFALARDGFGPRRFAALRPTGAPATAIAAAVGFGLVALIILHGVVGVGLNDSYFYFGTVGSLSLLVAYAMTSLGAIRLSLRERPARAAGEIAVIVLGIAVIGYILYKSVYPVPASPANVFPWIVAAWLLLGAGIAVLSPGLAGRIGRGLAASEGFAEPAADDRAAAEPTW